MRCTYPEHLVKFFSRYPISEHKTADLKKLCCAVNLEIFLCKLKVHVSQLVLYVEPDSYVVPSAYSSL